MTVYVASTPISSLTGVPGLVLGFIDGGPQWFDWATTATASSYRFDDQSALVAGVQTGLHASPLLLMPGLALLVSPVKLMTIGLADLQALAAAEAGTGGPVVAATVPQILDDHALVTQPVLAAGPAFLEQLGVADAPVFQCMGLNDQLALLPLLPRSGDDEPPDPDILQEAAAFAVAQARTPLEFVDYYEVYLRAAAVTTSGDTPKKRAARAQAAIDTLLPLLFGALDCPRVDGLVAPWEVAAAIDEWLMMNRRLGFSRLSRGVQQVVVNTDFLQRTGDDARQIVDAYLAAAQALLQRATLGRGQLGQDGASCTFPVRWESEEAVIALGPEGIITLSSYRRLPQAAPSSTKGESN